jgi:hypothetical protein
MCIGRRSSRARYNDEHEVVEYLAKLNDDAR